MKTVELELMRRGVEETGRYHEIDMGRGDRATSLVTDPTDEKVERARQWLWELSKRLRGDYEYVVKITTTTSTVEWDA